MKDKKEIYDMIPDKIYKRLHLSYFTFKAILIGAIFFCLFQAVAAVLLIDRVKEDNVSENFAGHTYCGTFFITRDKENSFSSDEAYNEYMNNELINFENKPVSDTIFNSVMTAISLSPIVLLFMVFRNADKKELFVNKSSRLLMISGIIFASCNIFSETNRFISQYNNRSMFKGVMASSRYYCQIYNILIIPLIIFTLGLIMRHHELKISDKDTVRNGTALKITAIAAVTVSSGFILYRFCVRTYELLMVITKQKDTVRIPFYSQMLDLPESLARTYQDFRDIVILRFIKDLPVFAASAISIILFAKIISSSANGRINTSINRRRISVIIIMLVSSSLIFNLMGLIEVKMLNNNFTGIYNTAVYTIAIRAKCEPALFAVVIWFFSNFLQAVPEENCENVVL